MFVGAFAGPAVPEIRPAAEMHALRWSIELAAHLKTVMLDIWTTSASHLDCPNLPSLYWHCSSAWKIIQGFVRRHNLGIHHPIRRGNTVSKAIAEWGFSFPRVTFLHSIDDLPHLIRLLIARDAHAFVVPGG